MKRVMPYWWNQTDGALRNTEEINFNNKQEDLSQVNDLHDANQ